MGHICPMEILRVKKIIFVQHHVLLQFGPKGAQMLLVYICYVIPYLYPLENIKIVNPTDKKILFYVFDLRHSSS